MINNGLETEKISPSKNEVMRRFYSVGAEHRSGRVEMELKGDMPIGILFPMLIKSLGWRMGNDELNPRFRLIAIKDGKEINLKNSDTLISANIPSGSELRIMFIDKKVSDEGYAQDTILDLKPIAGLENGFSVGISPERREVIVPLHWDEKVKEPCLIASSGNVYPIRKPPIWIGRPDKGFKPEIDLQREEDQDNLTVSRRHAQIFLEDGKYVLRTKPSVWGTHVNGQEVNHNQSYCLVEGDRVKFGDVEMIFRLPC